MKIDEVEVGQEYYVGNKWLRPFGADEPTRRVRVLDVTTVQERVGYSTKTRNVRRLHIALLDPDTGEDRGDMMAAQRYVGKDDPAANAFGYVFEPVPATIEARDIGMTWERHAAIVAETQRRQNVERTAEARLTAAWEALDLPPIRLLSISEVGSRSRPGGRYNDDLYMSMDNETANRIASFLEAVRARQEEGP